VKGFIQVLFCSIILLFTTTGNSSANQYDRDKKEGKRYISIMAGYIPSFDTDIDFSAFPNDEDVFNFDSTYTVGGSIGYYLGENLRLEGELTYRKSEVDTLTTNGVPQDWDEEITLWNWMFNAYYTYPMHKKVSPYIGGGLGISHDSGLNGEKAYAYQGMLGVDFDIDYSSAISVGYRYFGTGEFERLRVSGVGTFNVKQNIFEASYRIKF